MQSFSYQVESQCERDIDIRGVPDPPMAIQKKTTRETKVSLWSEIWP